MKQGAFALLLFLIAHSSLSAAQVSLVPATPSVAPDYYCTWNLQGYVSSGQSGYGANNLRIEINEANLPALTTTRAMTVYLASRAHCPAQQTFALQTTISLT